MSNNQCNFLKELKMCLHELSIVDDTLEAFDVPKKYQQLRNWIIQIAIGWIVYIFYHLAICLYDLTMYKPKFTVTLIEFHSIILPFYSRYINILNALICGTIFGLVHTYI